MPIVNAEKNKNCEEIEKQSKKQIVTVAETVFVIPAPHCVRGKLQRESSFFSPWIPALGSRKAGSLAGVTPSVFAFRNRYYKNFVFLFLNFSM